MPNDIRSRRAGGTFFFTARTARTVLLRKIDALCCAVRRLRMRFPFEIEEIVVRFKRLKINRNNTETFCVFLGAASAR